MYIYIYVCTIIMSIYIYIYISPRDPGARAAPALPAALPAVGIWRLYPGAAAVAQLHVAAVLDGLDVRRDGRVRADAVLVHEGNQLGLR